MASIAIVGAGMAGAAAARHLHRHGHRVQVFDKGRGLGGRLAHRRLPGGQGLDHGAPYVRARDPAFAKELAELETAGAAATWGEAGWFVGVPGMPALARALLDGIDARTGCRVAGLSRHGTGWRLVDADEASIADGFDTVLVTAPAPQARALFATANAVPAFAADLERVRYARCWALLLAYAGDPIFPETYRRDHDPAAPLVWIARDATKPGRGKPGETGHETLVVHAGPDWSRHNLEREPSEVASLLEAEMRRRFRLPQPTGLAYAAAHRWRYAMVEAPIGRPCLWSPADGLGYAGDGCLDGRVEAAFLSGSALAAAVLDDAP